MSEENKKLYRLSRQVNGMLSVHTIKYALLYRPFFALALPFVLTREYIAFVLFKLRDFCINRKISRALEKLPEEDKNKTMGTLVKTLAMYLPQFHRVKENDEWWGEGFTEWTNVRAAKPLFEGQNQPRVPHGDIGYYDLSDVNVMRAQADMAKKYGLGGFCFYYYWFKDGHRLLERPVDNYIAAKDINFPFCFCWANENWTRAWDGGASNIIMPQDHGKENLLNMLSEMLVAFKDDRYIKIDGRPLLLVYRAELIENIKEISALWRTIASESGFKDLYLVSVQNFKKVNPAEYGFDAAMEFGPTSGNMRGITAQDIDVKKFENMQKAGSYPRTVKYMMARALPGYKRFRSVFPDWDNTARKKNNTAALFVGVNIADFKKHLNFVLRYTTAFFKGEERIAFINAWNEWAEGAYLEPDEKNGYAYLEAFKNAMEKKINEP